MLTSLTKLRQGGGRGQDTMQCATQHTGVWTFCPLHGDSPRPAPNGMVYIGDTFCNIIESCRAIQGSVCWLNITICHHKND